ncbi:hypothetical protein ACFLRF_04625 [Candidatus Altiarchaeota archaeon]
MRKIIVAFILALVACGSVSATPKQPLKGSYLKLNVVEDGSSQQLSNYTLHVYYVFPGKYAVYNYGYHQTYVNGESVVAFSMPPPEYGAVARIMVSTGEHGNSSEQNMTSDYYIDNLGKDHLKEFDYNLEKPSLSSSCIPLLDQITGLISSLLSEYI